MVLDLTTSELWSFEVAYRYSRGLLGLTNSHQSSQNELHTPAYPINTPGLGLQVKGFTDVRPREGGAREMSGINPEQTSSRMDMGKR